jgi:hypothetical protein
MPRRESRHANRPGPSPRVEARNSQAPPHSDRRRPRAR